MHKFQNKKQFRKSTFKGQNAQQRFNIISRKNTYFFGVLLLRFLFQLGTIPILTGSIMDVFLERKVKTWTKISTRVSVEGVAQQNKAMDKQWIKMLLAWTDRWWWKSRRRERSQAQGRISRRDRCLSVTVSRTWMGPFLCSGLERSNSLEGPEM